MKPKDKEYIKKLFPSIDKIKDKDICGKVIKTWYEGWKRSNFHRIEDLHQFEPARDLIKYTNVEHTNQVCQAVETVAVMVKEMLNIQINMDYLLAGTVLHDVDKIVIFDSETGNYTSTGHQFPHTVMGTSMALMEGLPEEVAHIIGAHSSTFPVIPPRSIEAVILYYVDQMVSQASYLARGLDLNLVVRQSLERISRL